MHSAQKAEGRPRTEVQEQAGPLATELSHTVSQEPHSLGPYNLPHSPWLRCLPWPHQASLSRHWLGHQLPHVSHSGLLA